MAEEKEIGLTALALALHRAGACEGIFGRRRRALHCLTVAKRLLTEPNSGPGEESTDEH